MTKKTLFIILSTSLLLTGCGNRENAFEKQLTEESGILEDTSYQEYEQYKAAGRLDADGNYVEPEAEPEAVARDGIHVTFAANNNLSIRYYSDAAHRKLIDPSDCYLQPRDTIHAVIELKPDVFSSMYSFAGFKVYEVNDGNKRSLSSTLSFEEAEDEYVLRIPAKFSGKELAVEPIGQYTPRTISLSDYYVDENDQKHELTGTWEINKDEFVSDTAEISPLTPYIVSYEYDSNEYFFLSAVPDYHYQNNLDGTIIFKQMNPEDETPAYSVGLKKYISVILVSDVDRTVSVNGGAENSIKANTELTIPHLKYGDVVRLQTNREWPGLANCRELLLTNTEPLANGRYNYTLTVPEKDGEFTFKPADYSYDHGRITFKCFGQTVTTPQVLAKGSRIYYEQAAADTGYWLAGDPKDNYIVVGEETETISALKAVHFTPKVDVSVSLPRPEAGGTVEYTLNGKTVLGDTCSTYSGETISMRFKAWEGWKTAIQGEATYRVGDSLSQTATANGIPISSVFTEDDEHKPLLSVQLEKSVGDTMEFTLEASGYEIEAVRHASGWKITDLVGKNAGNYNIITSSQTIVDEQIIGTAQPIRFKITNRAIPSGSAVRMVITKTDTSKNKTVELRYLADLNEAIEPIYLYPPGTNASSKAWYKSIEITIGVVDVQQFKAATAAPNVNITVTNTTTGKRLNKGDFIEAGQEVQITITAQRGYYLTGRGVSNDSYTVKMKYSDYIKRIDTLIKDHPAEKAITLKLDHSDSFAAYSYRLGGNQVTGTAYAKPGQRLELTYLITDPEYQLHHADGGFLGIGASRTKAVETISITAEMDGKTITKADFGIETQKGG